MPRRRSKNVPASLSRSAPVVLPAFRPAFALTPWLALVLALAVLLPSLAGYGPAAGTAVAASKETISIKAGIPGVYNPETNTIVVQGGVEATYKDYRLSADQFVLDLNRNFVTASGNVRLTKKDEEMEADYLEFDLNKEEGVLRRATAKVTGEGIKGFVYVGGAEISASENVTDISGATFTTCDLAVPHYHLEAREIKVYPDDRIELSGVSYFEGRWKLFYWPYLVIPLKKQNQFQMPQVGYSEADGWFLKTTYNYYRTDAAYGSFLFDVFQRAGFGTGIRHNYEFLPLGNESFKGNGSAFGYFRQSPYSPDPDWQYSLNHQQKLGDAAKLAADATYDQRHIWGGGVYINENEKLTLDQRDDKGNVTLVASHRLGAYSRTDAGSIDPANRGESFNLTGRLARDLTAKTNLTATANYQNSWGFDKDAVWNFDYLASARQDLGHSTLTVLAQQVIKPHQEPDQEEPRPWTAYSRLPEATWRTKSIRLDGKRLPLEVSAITGYYHEEPGNVTAGKLGVLASVSGWNWQLSPSMVVSASGSVGADGYTGGQERLTEQATVSWRYKPATSGISANVSYQDKRQFGSTPFTFDKVTPSQTVSVGANYAGSVVTAGVQTRYSFTQSVFSPITGSLQLRPLKDLSLSFYGDYDVQKQSFGTGSGTVIWTAGDKLDLNASAKVNLAQMSLERSDLKLSYQFLPDWKLDVGTIYTASAGRLTRGDFALTKDLHCRELTLRYDYVAGQVWLELRIKAFPGQQVRLGADKAGFMFEPDIDLEKIAGGAAGGGS